MGIISVETTVGRRARFDAALFLCGLAILFAGLSVVGAALGWRVTEPWTGRAIAIQSLASGETVRQILSTVPATAMGFAPLGTILIVALGAAVAERAGLFTALAQLTLDRVPPRLLTPCVVLLGFAGHQISDATMLVYFPLAAAAYAVRGRDPLLGVTTAFAAFSGGFAANLIPGQQDIVLLALTQEAARSADSAFAYNPLANWYFTAALALVYGAATWILTDLVLDRPRATSTPAALVPRENAAQVPRQGLGLLAAVGAILTSCAVLALLTFGPAAPLLDPAARGIGRYGPTFQSLPVFLMLGLLASGWAYGAVTGHLRRPAQVVDASLEGVRDLAPYILIAIIIAHLLVLLKASHLAEAAMVWGVGQLQGDHLSKPMLLCALVLITSLIDLAIGSASAKWAIMAPVVVPMFMAAGIDPALSTAAYRVGDSATNVLTPLMPCIALVLTNAQAWRPSYGLRDLMAAMLPFAATYLALGLTVLWIWSLWGLPTGPGS